MTSACNRAHLATAESLSKLQPTSPQHCRGCLRSNRIAATNKRTDAFRRSQALVRYVICAPEVPSSLFPERVFLRRAAVDGPQHHDHSSSWSGRLRIKYRGARCGPAAVHGTEYTDRRKARRRNRQTAHPRLYRLRRNIVRRPDTTDMAIPTSGMTRELDPRVIFDSVRAIFIARSG